MILEKLVSPITIINASELGFKISDISAKLKAAYSNEYAWDLYLHRQNKIEFLKENLNKSLLCDVSDGFWTDFYMGEINDDDLAFLVENLEDKKRNHFFNIRKQRKRLISQYIL